MDARTEFQEKLKYYNALEKKVRRLLLKEENEEAVKTLIQIIQGYKSIGVTEKAKMLEDELQNFATALNINLGAFNEPSGTIVEAEKPSEPTEESGEIAGFIESLEKKVKRRILQGKTQEAITDLNYIISELRKLHNFEKAELLEATLNQFIAELAGSPESSAPSVSPMQEEQAPQVYSAPPVDTPPIVTLNPPTSPQFTLNRPPSASPHALGRPPSAPPQSQANPNPEFAPNIADLLPGARQRAPNQMTPGPPMPPLAQPPRAYPGQPPQAYTAPPAQQQGPIAVPASPPSIPLTPPLQPPTEPMPPAANPSGTIKDQPFSEEELLLKKLFEIKDMLGKK